MTVVYNHLVANGSKGLGNFLKLLFRWKGSIYKLIYADLLVYVIIYYTLYLFYRFYLRELPETDYYRIKYHQLVNYCNKEAKEIPLQLVLGFYVSNVVTRWWNQFMRIPWPDTVAIITANAVLGHDDRGRMMRRTIMRYVNLCLIFTFTMIIIEHLDDRLEGPKYFVPIVWAGAIGVKARQENRIRDDVSLFNLIQQICVFRLGAADLLSYDWISFPLVYTQVVTLTVYIYFLACLVGKQMLKQDDKVDLYVAFFEFLEFFFMMGWLKVAETLINPFGEDDDDFEVNWLIDRNIIVSYIIVDEMNTEFPELVRDQYWDMGVPDELFYTETAKKYKTEGYAGSAAVAMMPETDGDNKSKRGVEKSETQISLNHGDGHETHVHEAHSTESRQLYDHSFEPQQKDSYGNLLAQDKDSAK